MPNSDTPDGDLLQRLERAMQEPFEGWDFSRLQGRMVEDALPWSYEAVARDAIRVATAVLDMDTADGRLLIRLRPLPPLTVATKGYAPHIPIARARLEPLGIKVHEVASGAPLPFPDATYDLVINRHGCYEPGEVFRVLKPEGTFITQQVGSRNLADLNEALDAPPEANERNLSVARRNLKDAGFAIARAKEDFPVTRFRDMEAIVYYLKAVSWQVPDFTIARYSSRLETLEKEIRAHGSLEVHAHRFLLIVNKLASC